MPVPAVANDIEMADADGTTAAEAAPSDAHEAPRQDTNRKRKAEDESGPSENKKSKPGAEAFMLVARGSFV